MKDLITRRDAAEVICNALRMPAPDYKKDPFHDSMSLAFAMAQQIPSAQQWVPVSEELPRKRGFYLITTEKTHDVDICSWNGSRFESYPNGCLVVLRPQAWMPLPDCYEEEQK